MRRFLISPLHLITFWPNPLTNVALSHVVFWVPNLPLSSSWWVDSVATGTNLLQLQRGIWSTRLLPIKLAGDILELLIKR